MPQKKIDFFGEFRPTGVDNTAAQAYQAMAGLASQVQSLAIQEGKRIKTEEGLQEGLKAGQEAVESGEPIEKKSSFTFKGQAYNEGVILSYRAQVRRDAKETLNRLQSEYELDPDGFRQVAEEYKQGITQGLPEDFKFVIASDLDSEIVNRATTLDDAAFERGKQQILADNLEMAEDLKDDILNAIIRGDEGEAERLMAERSALLQRGVDNGLIDPDKQRQDAENMREQITLNREIGKLDRLFSDDSLTFEERIQKATDIVDATKNKQFKDLSPDQRDALADALQGELNEFLKKEAEMNAQTQKEIALETVNLKLDAQFGRRKPSEIQSKAYDMFRNSEITESEYQGIMTDLAQHQAKQTSQALLDSKVSRRLSGDESIALTPSEADDFFQRNIAPALVEMTSTDRVALVSNFVSNSGVVPPSIKRQLTNNLRSKDQRLIMEAAQVIDNLDDIRGIEDPVTPHDRAFAQLVVDLSQVMEPEQALEKAEKLTDPNNRSMVEAREAVIKSEKYSEKYQEEALDIVDDGIDSINSAQITKEYKGIFEAHFKAGMDEDQAKEKAKQILQKNWTYSPSSDRAMKYAPEQYYSIKGETSYIKDQLNDFVMRETSAGLTGEKPQRVMLVSDAETGKRASIGQPDYLVYIQDENGEIHMVRGVDPKDGKMKPLRWSPDVKKQMKKMKSENLDKVIRKRMPDMSKMPLSTGFMGVR